jgi:hypothetical protein
VIAFYKDGTVFVALISKSSQMGSIMESTYKLDSGKWYLNLKKFAIIFLAFLKIACIILLHRKTFSMRRNSRTLSIHIDGAEITSIGLSKSARLGRNLYIGGMPRRTLPDDLASQVCKRLKSSISSLKH